MEELNLAEYILLLRLLRLHVSRCHAAFDSAQNMAVSFARPCPAQNCTAALAAPCPARIDAAAARVFFKCKSVMKLAA
jgi:hypothetical protein